MEKGEPLNFDTDNKENAQTPSKGAASGQTGSTGKRKADAVGSKATSSAKKAKTGGAVQKPEDNEDEEEDEEEDDDDAEDDG